MERGARPICTRCWTAPNLTCLTGARTTKIMVEDGHATGVEIHDEKTKARRVIHADAEVLLSAGAVQSPQILQLSGVGDPDASWRPTGSRSVKALEGRRRQPAGSTWTSA